MNTRSFTALIAALALAGCAQDHPATRIGAQSLREARSTRAAAEVRAAHYLNAAAQAKRGKGSGSVVDCGIYNAAAGELAVLLRTAEGGRLWNRPLTVSAAGNNYRLRLEPGSTKGVWSPNTFTSFVPATQVPLGTIRHRNAVSGIGGALVGIRKQSPREQFAPNVGITAPVTATIDFKGKDATLALRDPNVQPKTRVGGTVEPLAADFSAPLAYYPNVNETIAGIMGALRVSRYMDMTGLYLLQPYDPNRIPLIFVHGLISTPRMWRNVINEIEFDPVLRSRYQCWVFAYPTGNPVAYSALRFRQELIKAKQAYGFPKGFVLVGHSMGGIISRMQGTTVTRADWDRIINTPWQKTLMASTAKGGIIHDSLLFNANPDLRRTIYICTPHRGSEMAITGIGQLGMRLISLPDTLVNSIQSSAGTALGLFTGNGRIPNSVTSLSPKNPTLKVLDNLPYHAPYHTVYGNCGKKGPAALSSDGVVPYWSSHLKSAKSEQAVPGPHGACELPETITELKRLLNLHLQSDRN